MQYLKLLFIALLLNIAPAIAQDSDLEASLFGGGSEESSEEISDTNSDTGEDALFGGSDFIIDITDAEAPSTSVADELLANEAVAIGGRVSGGLRLSIDPDADEDRGQETFRAGLTSLRTRLFLDARPDTEFRGFMKGDISYSTDDGISVDLREMFIDTDINDTVFLRLGKQTVNWGVGRFFSPANLINIETLDPENPDAELAGPVALKAQLPIGTDNLTGYAIVDDIENGNPVALASRYEFLVGATEVTVGGVYQFDNPWSLMSTAVGKVGDINWFGEAVLEGNVNNKYIVEDSSQSSGLAVRGTDDMYFSATLGGSYTISDPSEDNRYSINLSGQYLYNGFGYSDLGLFTDKRQEINELARSGAISFGDLRNRSQHYAGANASLRLTDFDFSPSVFWLGSLGDGSGRLSTSVRYSGIENITPSFSYTYNYGSEGSEYAPNGADQGMSLSVSLGVSF